MRKPEEIYKKTKKALDPIDFLHVMYHEKYLRHDDDPLWFLRGSAPSKDSKKVRSTKKKKPAR